MRSNKEERYLESGILSIKATFIAGMLVLVIILKDLLELFFKIPAWIMAAFSGVYLIIIFIVLGTKKFDEKMKSPQIIKVGNCLTVISLFVFAMENLVLAFKDGYSDIELIILMVSFFGVTIGGTIYLLFSKK